MLAARQEIRPGTATSATLGSLWGAWFGLGSSILLDLEEDPAWTNMMIMGNGGLVGGAIAEAGGDSADHVPASSALEG